MRSLLDMPRAPLFFSALALAGVAVFGFAIAALMLPHAGPLGDRQSEMTCLQVAFTSARASAIIGSFRPEAQAAMARLLVPGDMVFAWGYGLILAGLIGLLARSLDGHWREWGAIAIWFPLAAALLDDVEDLFLYQTVQSVVKNPDVLMSPILPAIAGVAALLKYTALLGLTPLYAIGGIVRGVRVNRSPGAIVVYALLLLMIASLFGRVAPQLPQCF